MSDNFLFHNGEFAGPPVKVARGRFTPTGSVSQTLTEGYGITSVSRAATVSGSWTVQLVDTKVKDMECFAAPIENDATHYHVMTVEAITASTGCFNITHKSVAYASVASGPSASDTVDQVQFICFYRLVD